MERVTSIVPRLNKNNDHPKTLSELLHKIETEEARDNPDLMVDVGRLEMADADTLVVPDGRGFLLNDWSRRQLASMLGLRWDRWFENAKDSAVAEELNRRLARAEGRVRLRSRNQMHTAPELRAIVSSGYTPLPDSVIASALLRSLGNVAGDPPVQRFAMTDMTTSFVLTIGEPYRPNGHGDVGDVWGGLICRNSNTGFASLVVSLFLVRLVCLNGMTVPHESTVIRRVHRGLSSHDLQPKLFDKLRDLPTRLRRGTNALAAAAHLEVEDVNGALRGVLQDARLPMRLLPGLLEAYNQEQHPTVFGLGQALTLAAQSLPAEQRFELEQAAGTYVGAQLAAS